MKKSAKNYLKLQIHYTSLALIFPCFSYAMESQNTPNTLNLETEETIEDKMLTSY